MLEGKNQSLISVLDDCARTCNRCVTADLKEDHLKMMVRCIELDIDCADFCTLTSHYVARSSEFTSGIVTQCALICDACAAECENHLDMPHCVECAKSCRKCAQECRKWQSS
jgi:Domain of Unknown Function (DUF326)